MKSKKDIFIKFLTGFTLLFLINSQTFAHGRYILPSHTVLSGDEVQIVSLTSSISNDFFHPDRPLGDNGKGKVDKELAGLFRILRSELITPNGDVLEGVSWQAFSRLSVADLPIEQDGTYRISLIQPETYMTTFKKTDGAPGRVFGKDRPLPEGSTGIVRRIVTSRVETFITRNQPNRNALKPVGQGLEIRGESHPNDLFVNEKNSFQLMFNGKPLPQSAKVTLIRGGTNHRNSREPIEVKTNPEGKFDVTFDKAGFYLMEAELTIPGKKDSGVNMHHYGLYLTLEVFPE